MNEEDDAESVKRIVLFSKEKPLLFPRKDWNKKQQQKIHTLDPRVAQTIMEHLPETNNSVIEHVREMCLENDNDTTVEYNANVTEQEDIGLENVNNATLENNTPEQENIRLEHDVDATLQNNTNATKQGEKDIPQIDGSDTRVPYDLKDSDIECIRSILSRSTRKRRLFKKQLSDSEIKDMFKSENSINQFIDSELNEIILALNTKLSVINYPMEMKNKGSKSDKVSELCKLFKITQTDQPKNKKKQKYEKNNDEDKGRMLTALTAQALKDKIRNKRRKKKKKGENINGEDEEDKCPTLKQFAVDALKKLGKSYLEAVYANYCWSEVETKWRTESPLNETIYVVGTDQSYSPVYIPAIHKHKDQELLHMCCQDGHHIRTNIRAKLCKDGTNELNKEAWIHVAKEKNTNLKLVMIEPRKDGKILDQQSDRFVRTMFSPSVQEELYRLGYKSEANFTKLFRGWFEAEDTPGIPAIERCRLALDLRNWLLKDVNFNEFPPPGTHINGFPKITFEGLICNIEAHLLMYPLSKSGSYNWRSLSTLVAENIFSEVTEMERHNNGVPSGESFKRDISAMTALHAIRLKPDRQFCMQTTKSRPYPVPKVVEIEMQADVVTEQDKFVDHLRQEKIAKVVPKNHEFDMRQTGNTKTEGSVNDPFIAPRGVMPVRNNYKIDESKMLWSVRLGLGKEL